jgi:glucosyl-dolichyl phosphate glucuronosyltransferase
MRHPEPIDHTIAVASVTAAVCTHNRASLLPRLLAALESIAAPNGVRFDVLIVDNASTDATREVIRPYVERNPLLFRYVVEPTLGLSHARNRALCESQSEVVAFLDDDAVPREGWLDAMVEGYRSAANVGAVGGQALLAFGDAHLPGWFGKPLYHYFSHREAQGDALVECGSAEEDPFGANISFLRAPALNVGGFDVNLGRMGARLLSGEETLLCNQMRQAGYRVLMQPRSIVDHYVNPARVSLRYLLRQAWADGQVYFVWTGHELDGLSTSEAAKALAKNLKWHFRQLKDSPRRKHDRVMLAYACVVDMSTLYHRWLARRTRTPA